MTRFGFARLFLGLGEPNQPGAERESVGNKLVVSALELVQWGLLDEALRKAVDELCVRVACT